MASCCGSYWQEQGGVGLSEYSFSDIWSAYWFSEHWIGAWAAFGYFLVDQGVKFLANLVIKSAGSGGHMHSCV